MIRNGEEKGRGAASRISLVLRLLMVVCVAAGLFSGYVLLASHREYAAGDKAYALIRQDIEQAAPSGLEADSSSAGTVSERTFKSINFAELAEINPDVVAWLKADEGIIDYPVVQGTDNEYYLDHLFTKAHNKLGSLFVDYRTPGDFSAQNTVIYGHNMKDGSMFSSLMNYKDQNYFETYPEMQLYTPGGVYVIEFFAGIVADGDYEFIRYDFKDNEDFLSYITTLKQESSFRSEVELEANDRIVTLCTCSYEYNNARYALFGKLVPIQAK